METLVVLGAADGAPFQKESQGVFLAQKQLMILLRVGKRVPGGILDADVHDDLFLSAGDRFCDLHQQYRTFLFERQEGRLLVCDTAAEKREGRAEPEEDRLSWP